MLEQAQPDKFEVAAGARQLVIDTAIRALIEHATTADPTIADRIAVAVDAYVKLLDPKSALEHDFAEQAKFYTATLVRPPVA